VPRDPGDTAVLIYTSGTTGKPKGAELTHFQLYMNCTIAGQLFGARSDDVTLAVLPFFHVFGLSSVINVAVRYGGCLSIVPRFQPSDVLDIIERDRCTVIGGVPTMLHALAQQDITGRDLSALRVAVSGGASLPEDIMRTFEGMYGIKVLEGYGRPDQRLGEEVVAVVVARPGSELGAEDVIAYCRERLAAYKYPREIRFTGELPKGPSGKILKSALRDA
jgi:acyl-CoA synthetase (AMP-forming)/AMP-acid ligase II